MWPLLIFYFCIILFSLSSYTKPHFSNSEMISKILLVVLSKNFKWLFDTTQQIYEHAYETCILSTMQEKVPFWTVTTLLKHVFLQTEKNFRVFWPTQYIPNWLISNYPILKLPVIHYCFTKESSSAKFLSHTNRVITV